MKQPPIMIDEDYDSWKTDIEIWEKVTDVPAEKRALLLHLSLSGMVKKPLVKWVLRFWEQKVAWSSYKET